VPEVKREETIRMLKATLERGGNHVEVREV
jgi:hypothetical protein